MKVRESEVMSRIDNDGVGIRDIDTILDDGSREQHVVVVVGEIEDDLLEFLRFHLSMSDSHTGIRDIFMDHLRDVREIADTIIDKVNLPIARHLEVDGIGDDLGAEGVNLRLDGIAVRGRCLDDTEITGSNQRELKRTGNRRCRHRQRIDIRLQLAQFLFRGDTKLLFLVDDE